MNKADVDALRGHALDDAAITVAVQVIAYFNYINRVADALDVDPESWMKLSREEWERTRGGGWG